jgi:hypothetical protein
MHWTERLSEYIDDELSPAERAACAAHLETCAACRELTLELREVKAVASAARDVPPAADLWPGILARIDGRTGARDGASNGHNHGTARRVSFTLPQLALAASLLIAVSSSVAYLAVSRGQAPPPAAEAWLVPIQAVAEPIMPPLPGVAPANFADDQFDQAVADLESILAEMRDELDPGTVMVIERNLATIDAAIREARAALESDPANPFLNSYLAESRRRKLDLLRRAAMLNTAGD